MTLQKINKNIDQTKEHTNYVRNHYKNIYSKKPEREAEDSDSSYDEDFIKDQLSNFDGENKEKIMENVQQDIESLNRFILIQRV